MGYSREKPSTYVLEIAMHRGVMEYGQCAVFRSASHLHRGYDANNGRLVPIYSDVHLRRQIQVGGLAMCQCLPEGSRPAYDLSRIDERLFEQTDEGFASSSVLAPVEHLLQRGIQIQDETLVVNRADTRGERSHNRLIEAFVVNHSFLPFRPYHVIICAEVGNLAIARLASMQSP